MNTRQQRAGYTEFLGNPQKQGVWSIALQPDASSVQSLTTLLNLGDTPYTRYRYHDGGDAEEFGRPAIVLPRLFAYLRCCLPSKTSQELPPLSRSDREPEREPWRISRGMRRPPYASSRYLHYLTQEPKRLSPGKKRALSKALSVFKSNFSTCSIEEVPERPSALDIVSNREGLYFQVQEDLEGRITAYALQEDTCLQFRRLFEALPDFQLSCESRKVFSPESQLLSMYMPTLKMTMPRRILRDAPVLQTIAHSMSEVRAGRFVHAIRAIGIGAEELIVEVYETYLHDKAPEAPLGNLLSELNSRIQEVQSGAKAKTKSPFGNLKKTVGGILSSERKSPTPNANVCSLCEAVLQGIIPTIEQLAATTVELEQVAAKPQKTIIFPSHANRSLSDLVPLRNRVSHRVDRLGSASSVTYLEAALALKSYIVLALWWQEERKLIDYRVGMKEAIKKAIDRNRVVAGT